MMLLQQLQLTLEGCAPSSLVPLLPLRSEGSVSRLSLIFTQMMSTRRSNTALTEGENIVTTAEEKGEWYY